MKKYIYSFLAGICFLTTVAAAQNPLLDTKFWKTADVDSLKRAIRLGGKVSQQTKDGATPLMLASMYISDPKILDILIKLGAKVNIKTKKGYTAIMYAALQSKNPAIIKKLMTLGADINEHNALGQTPLMLAVLKNRPNANLDVKILSAFLDKKYATKITYAQKNTSEDLKLSFDSRKKFTKNSSGKNTTSAYRKKNTLDFKELKKYADINARGLNGVTTLLYASRFNKNPKVISYLIQNGANINAQDGQGNTALLNAVQTNKNPTIVQSLLQQGAKTEIRNAKGQTALMLAVKESKNIQIVKNLLNNKSTNINSRDMDMRTPLMFANTYPYIKVLIDAGADVNLKDRFKATSLMYAALNTKNPLIISYLLDAGANAKIIDFKGKTALEYAKYNTYIRNTKAFWQLNQAIYE